MGGISEREAREKLNKVRENLYKKVTDIRNEFAKIEKIKVDALKKTEDLRRSAGHDVDKVEGDVTNSKDLAPESKNRLRSEIATLRKEIEEKCAELRKRISEAITPT